jgi:hypothetical protein
MVVQPRNLCKLACHGGFLRIHPTCVLLQWTRLSIHLRAPFTLKIGASVLAPVREHGQGRLRCNVRV